MDVVLSPSVPTLGVGVGGIMDSGGSSGGGEIISEVRGGLYSSKNKSSSLSLGLQQRTIKKGVPEKSSKAGHKDQEKVKLVGETLVEASSMKMVDAHFSQPLR